MRSYFEYKILKEAENESAPATAGQPAGSSLPNTPSSLPNPTTGAAPGSSDPMGLGALGGPSADSVPGGLDMGMGGPSLGGPGGQTSPKPLELKTSNVWDAFEKLLKMNNKQ